MQPTLFDDIIPSPSAKKPNTNRMYEDIRKEFARLVNIKREGKRVYTNEYVIHLIAKKFYRSERTIENIVFHRV